VSSRRFDAKRVPKVVGRRSYQAEHAEPSHV
jgi:hypothetical protein